MSNYNWPMTFGELCIAEAQRLIEFAVNEPHFRWESGSHLEGVEMDYWYGRPALFPSHVKWTVQIHGVTQEIGKKVHLHIKTKDIHALRLAMYHRRTA